MMTEAELQSIIRQREELQPNIIQRAYRAALSLATTLTDYLDISKWQPSAQINYKEVYEGGKKVIWLRTSDGKYVDPEFPIHWKKCLAEGISVAVYHFFRSNLIGEEQADLIWTLIQDLIEALGYVPFIWLDVESTDLINNVTRLDRLKKCLDKLNSYIWGATGQKERVGIYSSPGFANASLTPTPDWLKVTTVGKRVFQWLAHYIDAALPTQPTGWPVANRIGWQKGIAGMHGWIPYPVPGFGETLVDYDYAFMDEAEFIAFNGAVPNPSPDPDPIGDEIMYLADVVYLTPGTTFRNIRSKPHSVDPNKGIDVGDVFITDKDLPVYKIVTNSEGDWYMLAKGEIVGYVLGKVGATVYLQLKENPMAYVTTEEMDAAIAAALANLPGSETLPMTHKITTPEPNGVKLHAYPDGGEAVMLANLTPVRLLQTKSWKSQKLYAALVGGVWVSGWLTDAEVLPL